MKTLAFPELRQTYGYDCGASALQSVLVYYGIEELREDEIVQLAGTTEKDGTTPTGIMRVLQAFGLEHEAGVLTLADVCTAINYGHPVIMALQAYRDDTRIPYAKCWDDGHWVCAIGYDATRVYFEDPSSYKRTWLGFPQLLERWHDVGDNGKKLEHWGCIVKGTPCFIPNDSEYMA